MNADRFLANVHARVDELEETVMDEHSGRCALCGDAWEVPCPYFKYKVASGDHTPNPWSPRKNDQLVLHCFFVIPAQAGIQVGTHA
jgi:hypothetical protein